MRRLHQEYGHFKMGKLLGWQLNKKSEWRAVERGRLGGGIDWDLSRLAFQLRPEWRKGANYMRVGGKNIPEGTVRYKGPKAEANLVS